MEAILAETHCEKIVDKILYKHWDAVFGYLHIIEIMDFESYIVFKIILTTEENELLNQMEILLYGCRIFVLLSQYLKSMSVSRFKPLTLDYRMISSKWFREIVKEAVQYLSRYNEKIKNSQSKSSPCELKF